MSEDENKTKKSYKKSAVTKEKIYAAALSQMKKNGYQAAKIASIAKDAGVSVGTFYLYFKSKSDILQTLYSTADDYFQTTVVEETAEKDAIESLRIFTLNYGMLNTATGLDVLRVLFNPENEWFTRIRPMQNVLSTIIKRGQEAGTITSERTCEDLEQALFDLLRGVCYSWVIHNADFDLTDRMLDRLDLYLYGIIKR